MIDKRKTRNEKNAQTQRDRNTAADMDETRADGDDDDEAGYSEDDHGEDEDGAGRTGDGTASHSKRRQAHSFYFTTGALKRMESKEDGNLTATCRSNIIPIPNGDTQGVAQHFLKYHTDLNVRIRALKVLPGADKKPPGLYDITELCCTSDAGATVNHSGRTEPRCGEDTCHCH